MLQRLANFKPPDWKMVVNSAGISFSTNLVRFCPEIRQRRWGGGGSTICKLYKDFGVINGIGYFWINLTVFGYRPCERSIRVIRVGGGGYLSYLRFYFGLLCGWGFLWFLDYLWTLIWNNYKNLVFLGLAGRIKITV